MDYKHFCLIFGLAKFMWKIGNLAYLPHCLRTIAAKIRLKKTQSVGNDVQHCRFSTCTAQPQ